VGLARLHRFEGALTGFSKGISGSRSTRSRGACARRPPSRRVGVGIGDRIGHWRSRRSLGPMPRTLDREREAAERALDRLPRVASRSGAARTRGPIDNDAAEIAGGARRAFKSDARGRMQRAPSSSTYCSSKRAERPSGTVAA